MPDSEKTIYDRIVEWGKNQSIIAALLLIAALTVGLAKVYQAVIVLLPHPQSSFEQKLESAKAAYRSKDFASASDSFSKLRDESEKDEELIQYNEALRNAWAASNLFLSTQADCRLFLPISHDLTSSEKLEEIIVNAIDEANELYPYGVKHESTLPSNDC